MPSRIEDYAVIGNLETLALVGRDGSIDWLCLPRFDSPACFAALLGGPEHGRWRLAPVAPDACATRRYRADTLILETDFETADGAVRVTDFMARRPGATDLVRQVRGLHGRVAMQTELVVRYDYGSTVPWVERQPDGALHLTAGPDRLALTSPVELTGDERMRTVGGFTVGAGDELGFVLTGSRSYRPAPPPLDIDAALRASEAAAVGWLASLHAAVHASEAVRRSLLTLKALTHWETGGIVAAGTASLPEHIGGARNWDYRYCWLRDATLTLFALVSTGSIAEAQAWREWLVRAVAGSPADLQIMYGVAGERRLDEYELDGLPGYEGSRPVRVGNAAAGQLQLDVYGEVIGALYVARCAGVPASDSSWALERGLLAHLETIWEQPDQGIWEVRGGRRQFTHSKVMAWLAFDRGVRSAIEFGLPGPVERWSAVRDRIHAQVCERGFDADENSFVQSYGATALDASLLLIPMIGFLPPDDPRVRGTLAAVERRLLRHGLVLRYDTEDPIRPGTDGLPPGEGAFLACSFWLADNYILQGRMDEAQALFDRLLGYRNDVGLLAEEVDPVAGRQLGNFPQAFSHVALVNTANRLARCAIGHAGSWGDDVATPGASRAPPGRPLDAST